MSEFVLLTREDLVSLLEDFACRIQVGVAAAVGSANGSSGGEQGGIIPNKIYSREEAARALGFDRTQTLSEISEGELPCRRIGPKGGRVCYLGRDLLRYVLGLPPTQDDELTGTAPGVGSIPPIRNDRAAEVCDKPKSSPAHKVSPSSKPFRSSSAGRTRIL